MKMRKSRVNKGEFNMVEFDNIEVIDGYIEADAYIETEGIREHIRAKIDGTYHSSQTRAILAGTANLISMYNKDNELPKKITIAWY